MYDKSKFNIVLELFPLFSNLEILNVALAPKLVLLEPSLHKWSMGRLSFKTLELVGVLWNILTGQVVWSKPLIFTAILLK